MIAEFSGVVHRGNRGWHSVFHLAFKLGHYQSIAAFDRAARRMLGCYLVKHSPPVTPGTSAERKARVAAVVANAESLGKEIPRGVKLVGFREPSAAERAFAFCRLRGSAPCGPKLPRKVRKSFSSRYERLRRAGAASPSHSRAFF
jgi:hypothetical protein